MRFWRDNLRWWTSATLGLNVVLILKIADRMDRTLWDWACLGFASISLGLCGAIILILSMHPRAMAKHPRKEQNRLMERVVQNIYGPAFCLAIAGLAFVGANGGEGFMVVVGFSTIIFGIIGLSIHTYPNPPFLKRRRPLNIDAP